MNKDMGKWHWRRRQRRLICFAVASILMSADSFQQPPLRLSLATLDDNHHRRHDYFKLRQMGNNDYLSSLSANLDGAKDDDDASTSLQIGASPINIVQSVFKSATSGMSSELEKRTNDINSITRSFSSGIESVAKMGTSSLSSGVEKRTSDIQSVARTASSGFESVANKGAKDFRRTKLYAGRAVKRGTSDVINLADSGLTGAAKWINSQATAGTKVVTTNTKRAVLNFTGKSNYEFGDVSKETIRRIAAGEVNIQDAILLLKILLAIGATVGPLAELLPFTFLLEALNISIEQKVGGKVLEVLAKSLDSRIVGALFSSEDRSLIGDVAKRSLISGISSFTGKTNYESGDIQRAVLEHENDVNSEEKTLDIDLSEFAEWDQLFIEKLGAKLDDAVSINPDVLEKAREMDMKIALALEECDALSQRKIGLE